MTFPAPVIYVAIEPKTKADQEKLGVGDPEAGRGGPDVPGPAPTRRPARRSSPAWASCTSRSWSTGCARVQRRGQRRQAAGGLPRDHPSQLVEKRRSTPTRSRPAGRGSSPSVQVINLEPTHAMTARTVAAATSSSTRSPVVGSRGSTSRRSTPAAQDAMEFGVLAGYPHGRREGDAHSTVSYHEVDSSELAFKIAGSMVFKEAARRGQAGDHGTADGGRGDHARGLHG